MSFEGRVALVTGSTRGIGWATAELLAERGATVVVNGTDADRAAQRAAELAERFGGDHMAHACDVSDPAAVSAMVKTIFGGPGRLDVVVNNAGILDDALLGMISASSLERTYAVNVQAVVHVIQAAVRLMRRGGGGSIVNVSSIIGTHGNVGQVAYGGAKAAVIGVTKSAAKELAPAGIRVNAVTPGFIDTDMIKQLSDDVVQERLASIAMGRAGTAADVARAIAFLASDDAAYVTGQVLGVDGGMVV